MTTSNTPTRLSEAIQIANSQFGEGAADTRPELLAAIVNSLAIEALQQTISQETAKLAEIIAQSAAVAAGS